MNTPELHPATLDLQRLLSECQVVRTRRSGPGGQHRNKVETAVVITHQPSGVTGEASERRSQQQNRSVAISRLRVNLALQVRCPHTHPSPSWLERCHDGRLTISRTNDQFPTLLAEALDVLDASNMDVKSAADALQITVAQLGKFLKLEPRAITLLNEHRRRLGLHALR